MVAATDSAVLLRESSTNTVSVNKSNGIRDNLDSHGGSDRQCSGTKISTASSINTKSCVYLSLGRICDVEICEAPTVAISRTQNCQPIDLLFEWS